MSRLFNGGVAADSITFSVGNAPPDQGPITMAVLAKATGVSTNTSYMVRGRTGSDVWGLFFSNNAGGKLFIASDFGNGGSGLTTSWAWYAVTKASGSSTPRFHVGTFTGGTISWAHANESTTVGDGTGPITSILLGDTSAGTSFRGSIAVVAAWDSVLASDPAVEAALTANAADTLAAAPKWMIRLNQASTATSITDDTGGGGNQSAISGTSIDADDPPAYSYSLGNTLSAAAALAVTATLTAGAVATHSPAAALSVTAALAAAATDVQAPAAALSVTATMTAAASRTAIASAALAVTATLAADAPVTKPAGAALTVTATFTATTGTLQTAGAALAVVATLVAVAAGAVSAPGPTIRTTSRDRTLRTAVRGG